MSLYSYRGKVHRSRRSLVIMESPLTQESWPFALVNTNLVQFTSQFVRGDRPWFEMFFALDLVLTNAIKIRVSYA